MKKLPLKTALTGACAAAVTGWLAGCAVGPNFKAPEAPRTAGFAPVGLMPATTTAAALPGGQAQRFVEGMDIPGQWWTLFQSAQLNALIERGLKNSPTLQAAQAALRQANEIAAAQRGSYYPSVSGTVESQRQKGSGASFGIPGFPSSYYYNLQTASVNVSYTLDAFGGTRRQVEALQAQAEYEQFALEASYLTLTANIVTAAVNESSLRAQIAATDDIARSQQRQLDIAQRRFAAGAAARADVLQQQATLQATLAALPPLRSQLAQQRNQLAAYVGDLPADYTDTEFNLDSLNMPQDLPVSLPSKLVEQRPDIREYSALLHQATAQIGVATANMLPQITLSGSYGQTAAKWAIYSHPPPMCTASSAPSRSRSSKGDSSCTSAAPPWPPPRKRPPTIRPPSSTRLKTSPIPCTRCRATRMRWWRNPPPSAARRTASPWFKRSTRAAQPPTYKC